MAFERIRVLRHLLGGVGARELTSLDNERSLQGQVELRSMLTAAREHDLADIELGLLPYAVIDTETTGFSPQEDRLLSVGAVLCDPANATVDAAVDGGFHSFVGSPGGIVIPQVVMELTGITASDLVGAPAVGDVLQLFLQYVGDRTIVAHHAAHDMRFLSLALRRTWGVEWQPQVLDTGKWAMCLHTFRKYPTLDMLLALYEVPVHMRHSALGDALMTERLLRAIIRDSQERGVKTLGDLWERLLLLEHQQRPG